MKKVLIACLISAGLSGAYAQSKNPVKPTKTAPSTSVKAAPAPEEPVLLRIENDGITRSEFDRVFRKNNRDSVFTEQSIRDYLELYINYKLKVKEAEAMQMDTSENFKSELVGYRKQLSQPYLVDKDVNELLVKEAYDRLNKDVRASHILLKLNADALPKDTVAVYNRLIKMRDLLLKGADFAKMARDSSEDPSAKDNNGDLGYFTGMQMVYPFETAAYSTKPGSIYMPVRTRFGYHIIKVVDVRAAQGEIHVAHIMVRTPKDSPDSVLAAADAKIREVEAELKKGMPWDTAVYRYSEDKGSVKRGGEIPWFGTGRMVPEFEKAAYALKNDGDVTGIVKTSYGYHIIKRLERRGIPSFDEKKGELKQMLNRDSRNEASRTSMINKIKKQYRFKEVPKTKDEFIATLDTTLAEGEWDLNKAEKYNKPLFTLTDSLGKVSTYTQQDFAKYISLHQTKRSGSNPQALGYTMYDTWVGEACLSYLESRLEDLYPEFRNLIREYRDGILLFDLTDKMVWSKAVKDTTGLQAFYDQNKNNYLWGERCDAAIYTISDAKIAAEFRKQLVKGKKPAKEIMDALNKKTPNAIAVQESRFNHGENEVLESNGWKKGISEVISRNNRLYVVDVKDVLAPMPKSINEAKGVITADYQSYLESEWIRSLRSKYKVEVVDAVLRTLWK
jgi:peptidyl-prolyl cis-trans isomerase SurA